LKTRREKLAALREQGVPFPNCEASSENAMQKMKSG
jgi:hypothetical protein